MHKFMNSMIMPNLDFKEKYIINFKSMSYNLCCCPIIKTIKALLQKPTNFTFAMVKWYDYCDGKSEIYRCPKLLMLNEYDIVPLDFIEQAVHIIPRFHKKKSIFGE